MRGVGGEVGGDGGKAGAEDCRDPTGRKLSQTSEF